MAFNKISGLQPPVANAIPMALPAGEVFMLPVGQGVIGAFGAVSSPQIGTNNPMSGQFLIQLGQYSTLQMFDATCGLWRNVNVGPMALLPVSSDGTNYRIANTSGTPVGAIITAAGSGGTNGFYGYDNTRTAVTWQNGIKTAGNTVFTITPSAGGSLWNAFVGGGVNTTIGLSGTVYQNGPFSTAAQVFTGSGGSGYLAPPMIVFAPPANQGDQPCILPTAVCTISGGAINSVTVTNQGAGLLGLPQITVVPAMGDTTGGGAILGWAAGNVAQVGSGTLMAMAPAFPGTAVTAVPTFTYGGSASPGPTVTAIMNFTITSFTTGTAGVGYVGAGGAIFGGIVAGSAANTNPALDKNLSLPVVPPITVAATTGVPSLAGNFGGVNFQAVPTYAAYSAGAAPSTAAVITANVGGASDYILIFSF